MTVRSAERGYSGEISPDKRSPTGVHETSIHTHRGSPASGVGRPSHRIFYAWNSQTSEAAAAFLTVASPDRLRRLLFLARTEDTDIISTREETGS